MLLPLIRVMTYLQLGFADALDRPRDERGQSMAEYALLLVGVGLLAVFVFKWFQGSGLMEKLFTSVIGKILPG